MQTVASGTRVRVAYEPLHLILLIGSSLSFHFLDYNCWEEVRRCLSEFITLRITLSGTSAVSATDVYGEHVYEFDDVCVGWRFGEF